MTIPKAVASDPADHWESRSGAVLDPLIGSFGYIRGAPPFDRDEGFRMIEYIVAEGHPFRLMVSPFYASKPVPYNPWGFMPFQTPDRVLCLYFDGHIKFELTRARVTNIGFSWAAAFFPPYPETY